jgi:hypothetical protein
MEKIDVEQGPGRTSEDAFIYGGTITTTVFHANFLESTSRASAANRFSRTLY